VLGFLDEISRDDAMKARAKVLRAANDGRVAVKAQILFKDVVQRFLECARRSWALPRRKGIRDRSRTTFGQHLASRECAM
jgi:hypothetical protein